MTQFSVNQLIKAMFCRSKSNYYRKRGPYLRNRRESLFCYFETIAHDLQRKPDFLVTNPEMVNKVTKENLDMDRDFQIIGAFLLDGENFWEFKKQKTL